MKTNGSRFWVLGSGFAAAVLVAAAVQLPIVEAQAPAPSFAATVYPVLEKANCRACHTDEGVASGTRLHFPADTASADEIDAFGLTLAALVNRDDPSSSLLLNKPTNRVRHVGGLKIEPGSPDEQAVRTWVQHLATVPDSAVAAARARLATVAPAVSHQVGLRRLTHSQYNNTVRDLLGDHSRPADRFPPEDFVGGFKNQTRTQGIPPVLEDAYSTAAERMATNAFRAGDVNGLVPCKNPAARDVKCRDQFVRSFGEKAFRRPLNDVEVRRYTELFAEQANTTGKFLEGARVVVEAMLQSPKFLFHVTAGDAGSPPSREASADRRDYAIANRLSYLLWDTMPDRGAARRGGEGRAADTRWHRAHCARHASGQAWAAGGRRVLQPVAALRSHAHGCQRRRPLSDVHARARGDDGAGDPDAPGPSGVERPQLHGCVHRRLQLPERRARAVVRCARAGRGVRAW